MSQLAVTTQKNATKTKVFWFKINAGLAEVRVQSMQLHI